MIRRFQFPLLITFRGEGVNFSSNYVKRRVFLYCGELLLAFSERRVCNVHCFFTPSRGGIPVKLKFRMLSADGKPRAESLIKKYESEWGFERATKQTASPLICFTTFTPSPLTAVRGAFHNQTEVR